MKRTHEECEVIFAVSVVLSRVLTFGQWCSQWCPQTVRYLRLRRLCLFSMLEVVLGK